MVLLKEEIYDLYMYHVILKLVRLYCAWHVTWVGSTIDVYIIMVKKSVGKRLLVKLRS
jgi:hypothetical protein